MVEVNACVYFTFAEVISVFVGEAKGKRSLCLIFWLKSESDCICESESVR